MGVNNRQRRAAKQRKRARQRAGDQPTRGTDQPWFAADPAWDGVGAYEHAELHVTTTVRRISKLRPDDAEGRRYAESLLRNVGSVPRKITSTVVTNLVCRLADGVVRGGWGPADLEQLVGRHAGDSHVVTLLAVLYEHARREERIGKAWLAALAAVGPEARLQLADTDRLASCLRVAALLATAPLLDADAVVSGQVGPAAEHPKLARVRALLAKAESTQFDEEAEALSAKAQELVSRYSLERLVGESDQTHGGAAAGVRRIWLDAPYVGAKASLVHEVAAANRCRAAVTESLGFCVVIGASADLDGVELLVTSLLVQASRAMLRHGRRVDDGGRSRTRSFRQAFLLAYAARIGERLRVADEVVTSEEATLVPVLRAHEERVSAAFETMVGQVVTKKTAVNNGEGWVAGLAAADLALLDANGQLDERAG